MAIAPPRSGSTLPHTSELQKRFDLTPQEARVTLLLAERRTNMEISDALSISIHTARHHVRHALDKMGIPRREVRRVICTEI